MKEIMPISRASFLIKPCILIHSNRKVGGTLVLFCRLWYVATHLSLGFGCFAPTALKQMTFPIQL